MAVQSNKAPNEFLKRYNRIKTGQEKIESVEQLKDFWLFAIGLGERDITVREVIAELVNEINEVNISNISYICRNNLMSKEADQALSAAFLDWESSIVDPTSSSYDEEEGIQYSNWQWGGLRTYVEAINPRR